jgi:hypothetical protein
MELFTKEDHMKLYSIVLGIGILLPCAAWAGKQLYAVPIQKDVPAYASEIRKPYEKPAFVLDENSRYVVRETGKSLIKIRDNSGNEGWVERSAIKTVFENASFTYDSADVMTWLENPNPFMILETDPAEQTPIVLERSFADALRDNVDHETVSRQINVQ